MEESELKRYAQILTPQMIKRIDTTLDKQLKLKDTDQDSLVEKVLACRDELSDYGRYKKFVHALNGLGDFGGYYLANAKTHVTCTYTTPPPHTHKHKHARARARTHKWATIIIVKWGNALNINSYT